MQAVYRLLLTGLLVFCPHVTTTPSGPAFSSIPELEQGYRLLYMQKFPEARDIFQKWAADNPEEPFGQRRPGVPRSRAPADCRRDE